MFLVGIQYIYQLYLSSNFVDNIFKKENNKSGTNVVQILIRKTFASSIKNVSNPRICFNGCRMGRSDKVSLWYVSLFINSRFRFFILE